MTTSIKAYINPAILKWAREIIGMPMEIAAKKSHTSLLRLECWERGEEQPTLRQMRAIAKMYRRPLAFFYLPCAPLSDVPKPKDLRRLPGLLHPLNLININLELFAASNRRKIALELSELMGNSISEFNFNAKRHTDPEKVAEYIRQIVLQMKPTDQPTFKDSRLAFNFWRGKLEDIGILIFQATDVDIADLRGYSLYFDKYPIIGVNRKDALAARSFSLFHEFTHLLLRQSTICDLQDEDEIEPDLELETFCNHVAGATLVPLKLLLASHESANATIQNGLGTPALESLAKKFGVSREVVLRRLLIGKRISESFYRAKRREFASEIGRTPKNAGGFVHPVVDVVSSFGKPLVRLAIESYNSEKITSSDFSGYLNLKLKHFDKLLATAF